MASETKATADTVPRDLIKTIADALAAIGIKATVSLSTGTHDDVYVVVVPRKEG